MPVLPSIGDQFGRYRIDSQLGFGGMGVVYAATDLDLGRKVALKVVSAALGEQEFLERFQREAEVLARLNSPHVIAIYDVGTHDGAPYIVTQYIGGGDLGGLMRARGPMPPPLAALVCAEVAEALSDAHRAGVVHRDIKPSNVLLRNPDDTRDPMAYLCDFGIAHTETDGFARTGTVSGTWSYLSPECGRGEAGTPAADIYASGCLLWAALTGHAPYAGTDVEIAIAHQTAPIPQLAGTDEFSAAANAILLRSMAKDPRDRYPNAEQLRDDLMTLRGLPAPPAGIVPVGASAAGAPPTGQTPLAGVGAAPVTSRRTPVTAPAMPRMPGRSRTQSLLLAGAVGVAAVVVGSGAALGITRPWSDDSGTGGSGQHGQAATPKPDGPVLGDADGDGYGDVVTYPYSDDEFGKKTTTELTTWKSNGTTLTPATKRIEGKLGSTTLAFTGDFDGDGKGDLLTASHEKDGGDVFPVESSTGKLTGDLPYPSAEREHKHPSTLSWTALDYDGDGLTDIVWEFFDSTADGNTYNGKFRLWVGLNNGSGFDKATKVLQMSDVHMEKTAVGDVDGDKRADLVVLDRSKHGTGYHTTGISDLHTYTQQDGGGFEEQKTVQVRHQFINGLLLGDTDGDGANELVYVFADNVTQTIRVSDFDDGVPGPARVVGSMSEPDTFSDVVHPLFLSDLNGDGRADLATFTKDKTSADYVVQACLGGETFSGVKTWATWAGGPTALHSYQLTGAPL